MFDELLTRAQNEGVDKIEFHARETTSYQGLVKSRWAPRLLYNKGYIMVDHGQVDSFEGNNNETEGLYLISLERLTGV